MTTSAWIQNLDFYAVSTVFPPVSVSNGCRNVGIGAIDRPGKDLVANLSSGYKQRLALAAAIIADPELVFLDEPTSGVSPNSRRQFFEIIKTLAEKGTTVIVTIISWMKLSVATDRLYQPRPAHGLDAPDQLKQQFIEGLYG
jgi:ABC-2 type transport system ATP-binding protein